VGVETSEPMARKGARPLVQPLSGLTAGGVPTPTPGPSPQGGGGSCPSHASLHGNSARFSALKAKSETRPMTPMTMMPKMIWPVASSAWLAIIM